MFIQGRLMPAFLRGAEQQNTAKAKDAGQSSGMEQRFTALGEGHQSFSGKWRPEQRFLISSDEDRIIRRGASAAGNVHKTPLNNRFSMLQNGPTEHMVGKSLDSSPSSLANITLADRLDVHGHGSTTHVGNMNAQELAQHLVTSGLKEVGILKLQSCNSGKGDKAFVYDLREHLTRHGVKVGYISAYNDVLLDARGMGIDMKVGTLRWPDGLAKKVRQPTGLPFMPTIPVPAHMKQSIVKGNVDISFTHSRYDLPPSMADQLPLKAKTCHPNEFGAVNTALEHADPETRDKTRLALLDNGISQQAHLSPEAQQQLHSTLTETLQQGGKEVKATLANASHVLLNSSLMHTKQDKIAVLNNLKDSLPLTTNPMGLLEGFFIPLGEAFANHPHEKAEYLTDLKRQVNKCTQMTEPQKSAMKDIITAMQS